IYTWTVSAFKNENETTSSTPIASEMRFKILEQKKVDELSLLQKSDSHLARSVFYAEQGMAAEAERELKNLIKANPDMSIAAKLLRLVQSWRER
ncbi:MAG: hypothetical protein ACRD63_14920, partial [Pyrinomonadaceae bacterium]